MRGKAQFSGGDISILGSTELAELRESLSEICPPVHEAQEVTEEERSLLAAWNAKLAESRESVKKNGTHVTEKEKFLSEITVDGGPYNPRDGFVDAVLVEANSVKVFLDGLSRKSILSDFIAECDSVRKQAKKLIADLEKLQIKSLSAKLRCMSPDLRRNLKCYDPVQILCADALDELAIKIDESIAVLNKLQESADNVIFPAPVYPPHIPQPPVPSLAEQSEYSIPCADERSRGKDNKRTWEHYARREAAIRILRVAQNYGMKIAATYNDSYSQMSPAVRLLHLLGPYMTLASSGHTWRNVITELLKLKENIFKPEHAPKN